MKNQQSPSPTKENLRGSKQGIRASGASNSSNKSKKISKLRDEINSFYQLFDNLQLKNQQLGAWYKAQCINPFSIQKLKDHDVRFLQGFRIYSLYDIKSNAKNPIMIISRDNKTSFIVLSSEIEKKDIQEYSIQDFKSWKGIRYVKNEQIYMGQFKYFHRQSQHCIQVTKIPSGANFELSEVCKDQLAALTSDLYCIYQGEYFYDMRQPYPEHLKKKKKQSPEHLKKKPSQKSDGSPSLQNKVYQLQPNQKEVQKTAKLTYYEQNGQRKFSLLNIQYRSGRLNCDAVIRCHLGTDKANNKKNIIAGSFVNGYFSQQKNQKNISSDNHYHSYLGLTMSDNVVKTLQPKQWLNPNILSYFLRRVEFAAISKSIQHRKKNFFVQPVNFLQTLKSKSLGPSDIKQAYEKIDTNLINTYRFMGLFPLELFGLTLIPYNRDQSHFALAAVLVQPTIDQSKQLKNVKITIFDLDSIYRDKLGEQRLKEYLQREISFIKIDKEKQIYLKSLQNVTIQNIRTLKFPQQNNGYDCGLWVCIYGYFLYKRYICNQDIGKLTRMPEKNLQKLREFLKKAIATQEGDFIEKVQKIILQKEEINGELKKTRSGR